MKFKKLTPAGINLPLYIISFLLTGLLSVNGYAQNIAITDDDKYSPHESAMLDVNSITRGFLVPRMTTDQRDAVKSPAVGLMVYDTDLRKFYFYNGSTWSDLSSEGIWTKSGSYVSLGSISDRVGLGTATPLHKLHLYYSYSNNTGTDGNFIDIQNSNINTNVMSGIRFQNGTGNTYFKGAIFYQDMNTYGRGDLIFANDPVTSGTVSADDKRMVIRNAGNIEVWGNPGAAVDDPLFEVINKDGDVVFGVYNEGVRINVADSPGTAKGTKGGFAVGGFSSLKGPTNEYLRVTPDSVRIYIDEEATKGTKGGFAVGGFSSLDKGDVVDLMHLTPDNYFIGHSSGINNNLGVYNSFVGFESGMANTDGSYNVFLGYQAGKANQTGNRNIFIGDGAGLKSVDGLHSTAIGYDAGRSMVNEGNNQVFLGYKAGYACLDGSENTYLGSEAGYMNSGGGENVFIGTGAGRENQGSGNVFIGYSAGKAETGSNKLVIGNEHSWNDDWEYRALIYGEFDNDFVRVNGQQEVKNSIGQAKLTLDGPTTQHAMIEFQKNNAGEFSMGHDASNNRFFFYEFGYGNVYYIKGGRIGVGITAPTYKFQLPNSTVQGNGWGAANQWYEFSDLRVKKEAKALSYGLDDLMKLSPKEYKQYSSDFIDNNLVINEEEFSQEIGLIAQDVYGIIPEAVSKPEDENRELWTMNYSKLVPVLIKAVQDQQKIIEEMQKRIEALEHPQE